VAAQLSFLTPELASRRYPDIEKDVTKEWVSKFLASISANETPLEKGDLVPNSFFSCLREGEFTLLKDLGIDLQQLLHVSQQLNYFAQIRVGDTIVSKTGIEKISSRKLGADLVVFLEMYNKYFRKGELVAEANGTVIVREIKS
jgi:hypothetical protein